MLNTLQNSERYSTLSQSIFVNNFQEGTSQSPNLGIGAIVGMDAYAKPGAVILGKKISSTYQFGSAGEYATYMDISNSSNATPSIAISSRLWVQTSLGNVYYSDNYGSTFTAATFTGTPPAAAHGNGLIVYEDYVFAFYDDEIWVTDATHKADSAAPNFAQWKTGVQNGTQQSHTSPIPTNHFPYLFPNQRGVYFANNNCVGFFGQVFPVGSSTPTAFNPWGTINTDYQYANIILTLPSNYCVNTLDFISPSSLAIGANNISSGQEADIMTWDTQSANKFSAPIKMFSGVNINGSQGVKQLVNRHNVLYATVGGNHAFYETNGSTANIIADFSLYSVIRDGLASANGGEYPVPVYFNSFPSAIAVAGNKILTGTGASANNSYYPSADTGIFPCGVWSVYFNNDGSTLEQMEYSIPFLGALAIGSISSFAASTDFSAITAIKPLANGQLAVGWASMFGGSITTGNISVFDNVAYVTDLTLTSLESPMYEIGTALNPTVPGNIEINLIKNLLAGQTIEVSYRTSNDQDWTVIPTGTFTGDGTRNYYSVQEHGISATRYIQLRIRMSTGSPNGNSTPELRNVILS